MRSRQGIAVGAVKQRALSDALVLLVSLGASSETLAQTNPALAQTNPALTQTNPAPPDDAVTIHVDSTSRGAPLGPVWSYFGYDEANFTTSREARELLLTLSLNIQAPVYTRTHFLFNNGEGTPGLKWGFTNIYDEDASGTPIYDYTMIDEIMDATVQSGALPLFEFGFMPKALSTHTGPYENSFVYGLDGGAFYPPKDYEKWGGLVRAYAEHVKERYPGAEETWQWELWNEPDIGYFQGTFAEFARLYDFTEAALHEVMPNAPLGGPAIVRPDDSFLADFLEHCASGTNAVTGETGTRLDLVTFHAKGGTTLNEDSVRMNLGNQLRLHRLGMETVAASNTFRDRPIIISEADPDGCAACSSDRALHLAYRNSPAYGAYEVAMMKHSLDLADELGVDLRGVLTWAFTFPDSPYFPGYRALSTNGIHLPVLNAFKLLGRLAGTRLPVTSSDAISLETLVDESVRSAPEIDALATYDDETLRILVWHYHDDLVEAAPRHVSLNVTLPESFEKGVAVKHERVDNTHGNAFTSWEALGRPASPTESELEQLREAMNSMEFEPEKVLVSEGPLSIEFDLPRFGVSLLTLRPATKKQREGLAYEPPSLDPASCYCQSTTSTAPAKRPLLLLLIAVALSTARRRSRNPPQLSGTHAG